MYFYVEGDDFFLEYCCFVVIQLDGYQVWGKFYYLCFQFQLFQGVGCFQFEQFVVDNYFVFCCGGMGGDMVEIVKSVVDKVFCEIVIGDWWNKGI